MNGKYSIRNARADYSKMFADKLNESGCSMQHTNPLTRNQYLKRNSTSRTPTHILDYIDGKQNNFKISCVQKYDTNGIHFAKPFLATSDVVSNSDKKMTGVLERLTAVEEEISKMKGQKQQLIVKSREKQMNQFRELFTLVKDHKKMQAKINEDYYQQVQYLKKNIKNVKENLETVCLKHKLKEKEEKIFTFQGIKEENYDSKKVQEISHQIKNINNVMGQLKNDLQFNLVTQRVSQLKEYYSRAFKMESSLDNNVIEIKNFEIAIPRSNNYQAKFAQDNVKKEVKLHEISYYIDKDGFLLDDQMYYLYNSHNQLVRLKDTEIQALREKGLIMI